METVWAALLVLLIAAPHGADAQAAAQFAPTDIKSDITSRLVFRKEGLATLWKDPQTQSIVVRDRVLIEPDFWHDQFEDTGGVAVLSPSRTGLNFTITSADNASQVTPELNFNLIPNAMLVQPGAHLVFKDILLLDFAYIMMYQYSDAQPYRNVGVGWPLWPTLAMAPGSRVDLINVSTAYQNPAPLDTCEQYTERTVYALQQQYGNNVSAPNATTVALKGPLNILIVVQNGSNDSTLGNATAVISNATFHCVPRLAISSSTAAGLAPGILAAAIVVPVVAVLAAAVGAWLCWRRRRQHQRSAERRKSDMVMAVELGHGSNHSKGPGDVGGRYDQHPQTHYDVDKVSGVPGQQAYMQPYPDASSSSAATSSVVAPNMWSGSAHGTGNSGGMVFPGPGGVQQYPTAATPTVVGMPVQMGGAVGAAGLAPVLSQQFSSRQPSSGGTASQGQRYSGSYGHPSDAMRGPQTSGSGDLDGHALMNDGVIGMGRGGHTVSSSGQRVSGGSSADGNRGLPTAGSGGSGAGGPGGTGDGMSGSGTGGLSSGSTVFRSGGAGGVPALLKARSDVAVLRDLKIGPLLGRGSYGRVYKGRWKAVTVAVKIIEHMEGSPGTASGGGKRISIGREAQLATNIAHPNVVQTYQISTMTVSQRNALARTWMEEGNGHSSNLNQLSPAAEVLEGGDNDSSSSNDGNDEPQKDVLETWMIMEFCEKGSLDRAVNRKRFIRKDDGQPEMIGIYKALLDTASGLDYLHSIGVVHGDLKTANVLLKGSARDVRGFACKITDFGLSRVLDLDATHISTRTYGTIVYMPSELLLTGRMTQATDIYSFGLMMWELYMSCRIFNEGLSVGQIFYMIAYQNWRPDIPPGCPAGYADLMQACWHKNPEQRPTAQQVLKALQRLYVQEKQAASAAKQAHEVAAAAATAVSPSLFSAAGTPFAGHGSSGDPQQQGSDDSAQIGGRLSGAGTSGSGGQPGQHGGNSSGGTPQRASTADRGPSASGAAGAPVMLAAGTASYGDSAAGSGGGHNTGSGGGGPDSGSGGQGGGSGGSEPNDGQQVEQRGSQQYQPWAQAAGRVGQQLQEDWQEDQQHQGQPQHLTPRRFSWQPRAGPLQSVNEHIPVTATTDSRLTQATMMGDRGGYSLQTSYPVHQHQQVRYGAMELQPGDDDGIPSETLYQNDSLISNIAPDDDAEDLDIPRAYGYDGDAQIAAGYLDAVQTATRTNPSATAAAAAPKRVENNYSQQSPFQYEQQPRMVPRPLPGMRASQVSPGASVSSSTLGGGWGSVSTGTMPSVMGGNSSLNLSMMASQSMTSPTLGTAGTYAPGGSRSSMSPGSSVALQQQSHAAANVPASASSPFAALAQRAGSLFGPLVKQ